MKDIRGSQSTAKRFFRDINEMIKYGIPYFSGLLVLGLTSSYLMVILAVVANNTVVGLTKLLTP